jgi:hypothetical protein
LGARKAYKSATKADSESWREVRLWMEALSCLGSRCYPEYGDRWAGPIAAERLNRCRLSPYRERIAAACIPVMEDTTCGAQYFSNFNPRYNAALLLAFYGFKEVGGYDIFSIITSTLELPADLRKLDFYALASLQDPRTVPFLEMVYDSLGLTDSESRNFILARLINCLYHIPGDSAVAFAERIHREQADDFIRDRAQRVIHR